MFISGIGKIELRGFVEIFFIFKELIQQANPQSNVSLAGKWQSDWGSSAIALL
jgi:hypothetical protein